MKPEIKDDSVDGPKQATFPQSVGTYYLIYSGHKQATFPWSVGTYLLPDILVCSGTPIVFPTSFNITAILLYVEILRDAATNR